MDRFFVYSYIYIRISNILLLSATDKHFAFHKFRTGAKDRLTFKISHFAAQIIRVDIQTKVRKIQELLDNSDFEKWFAVL